MLRKSVEKLFGFILAKVLSGVTMNNNVILSGSEGTHNVEILWSLRSLRMTGGKGVNVFSLSKGEGQGEGFITNLRKELIKKPSPAFVVFANAQTQLLPLTKREGVKNHFLTSLPTNLLTFKPAFTLAEVLITLGIIGVVAAITIPMLIQNNQAAKLRSQYLKSYSVVSQALRLMENDDVSTNPRDYNTRNYFYKNFAKYLTNTTDCGGYTTSASSRPDGCYSYKIRDEYTEGYKSLDGSSYLADGLFNFGELMLPDGTLIFFDDGPVVEGWKGVPVYVDINGYKNKPNRLGYDFFAFEIVDGVLYAMGDLKSTFPDNKDDKLCKAGLGNYAGLYLSYSGLTCSIRAKNNSEYFKQVVKNYKG